MKNSIFIIYILLSMLIIKCTSDSPIEPDRDSVVIMAYVYAGEPVTDVRITSTLPIGAEELITPPINDAFVRLLKEDKSYLLVPSPGDSGYYHYPGDDFSTVQGDIVRIEVDYFGKTAYGESIVPAPPEGIELSNTTVVYPEEFYPGWQNTAEFENSRLTVRWKGDGTSLFFVVIESTDPDPVPIDDMDSPFGRGKFMFRSRPTTNDSLTVNFNSFKFLGNHMARIYRVNREYADLYLTQTQDSRDLNEPLSNINNGLGIFSAFNSKSAYFYVKQQ